MKWYRTAPRINRELTDTHKGWLEVVGNWMLARLYAAGRAK